MKVFTIALKEASDELLGSRLSSLQSHSCQSINQAPVVLDVEAMLLIATFNFTFRKCAGALLPLVPSTT
ncbi:unnamed protein product [Sphenostylis stenocarpa]|uniref:Uncharacterized protein n=1 Tax=Sphenostylis stenocarpa TaxID=92480 RepID=A0AA86SW91_9FABA|nr:unnamed protein product [Sphenostylis stenocarpa]